MVAAWPPRSLSPDSSIARTALVAPRILNDPVFCMDSALSIKLMVAVLPLGRAAAEARDEKKDEERMGVELMKGAMRARAAWMSSR